MLESASNAFQDYYPDDVAHCYGCGRRNQHGHQLKSFWDGDETVARFTPQRYHTAIPGYVYGGLIASLIDCHGTGSASAAAARVAGTELGAASASESADRNAPRFVTASLKVDYLKPTPLGPELEIRGMIKQASERKVVVEVKLSAEGKVTAHGEVVAVRMPESLVDSR